MTRHSKCSETSSLLSSLSLSLSVSVSLCLSVSLSLSLSFLSLAPSLPVSCNFSPRAIAPFLLTLPLAVSPALLAPFLLTLPLAVSPALLAPFLLTLPLAVSPALLAPFLLTLPLAVSPALLAPFLLTLPLAISLHLAAPLLATPTVLCAPSFLAMPLYPLPLPPHQCSSPTSKCTLPFSWFLIRSCQFRHLSSMILCPRLGLGKWGESHNGVNYLMNFVYQALQPAVQLLHPLQIQAERQLRRQPPVHLRPVTLRFCF